MNTENRAVAADYQREIIRQYNQTLELIATGRMNISDGLETISQLMEGLSATDFGDIMMRINGPNSRRKRII